MTLALKEWHVVADAIARGDQVVTLRKGGIHEKAFGVGGPRFWLYPTWEHQGEADLRRAWWGELARSNREQRRDGTVPVRCRATVVRTWEVTDPAPLAALERFHAWTPEYALGRLTWRPTKPLVVMLLRAEALPEPVLVRRRPEHDGCRSWLDLDEALPEEDLIPSLTDEAFRLWSDAVQDALANAGAEPLPVVAAG